MEWHGKGLDQGSLEHGKEICSSFKSNEVIKSKSNHKSRNKSEKFSKKESSEIQGVTVPLLGEHLRYLSRKVMVRTVWSKTTDLSTKPPSRTNIHFHGSTICMINLPDQRCFLNSTCGWVITKSGSVKRTFRRPLTLLAMVHTST